MADDDRTNLRLVRTVGATVGGEVYVPAVPRDASTAAKVSGYISESSRAVAAMDHLYSTLAAYQAHRTVVCDHAAEAHVKEESRRELQHQRLLAELRREREEHEAEEAVLNAQHSLEA